MIDRQACALFLAFALLTARPSDAQPPEPPPPTQEHIRQYIRNSEIFILLILDALRWKAPASQDCTRQRDALETFRNSPESRAALRLPEDEEGLIRYYARLDENLLNRHAIFMNMLNQTVARGCLTLPPENEAVPS